MRIERHRWLLIAAVSVTVFAVSYRGGRYYREVFGPNSSQLNETVPNPAAPRVDSVFTRLVLVYVGSNRCGACLHPNLPGAIGAIEDGVTAIAAARGLILVRQGVAINNDTAEGYEHLAEIGTFDEMIVGGDWTGHAGFAYMWDRHPGPAATPQTLLLTQKISSRANGYRILSEDVVARKVGLQDIYAWADNGASLSSAGLALIGN